MDIAKAMYRGGEIIHANECDSSSYKNLGLLCPFCSQEVYLRKGDIRKAYFAHFHATSSRQVEDCELRASVYGNSTQNISFIEDRWQRLEIFKKHFLGMISIEKDHIYVNLNFNNWMNIFKINIKNITIYCTEYFLTHRQVMEDKYIIKLTKIKDEQILLQQQIALEAMNYLCVKTNCNLLEYVLNYSMYKLYNQQQFKLLMQENNLKNIADICHYAAQIIINNPWVEALALVTDTNSNSQVVNTNIITKLDTERESAPTKQLANKFRSGFLSGWSMPFDIQLSKNDYHSAIFGTDPIRVQLCLEQNETLTMYRLPEKFYRSNNVNSPLALTQERIKMLDLASVSTVMLPQMRWLASSPKYEILADQMNQYGKLLPSTVTKFTSDNGTCHLVVTDMQVYVGKRVLVECKKIGERLVVRTTIKPEYEDMSWIKVIVGKAEKLMLQANVTELKNNHIPIITSKSKDMQIAHHKMKNMLSSARALVRNWQPDISDADLIRLANLLVKHAVVNMNMDKNKFLSLYFILKSDEQKYRQFVAEVLKANGSNANTDFYIHLLNYDGKLELPKNAKLPSSGTLFVTFGYKGDPKLFSSTVKLEFNPGIVKGTTTVKAVLNSNDTISYNGGLIVSYNSLVSVYNVIR